MAAAAALVLFLNWHHVWVLCGGCGGDNDALHDGGGGAHNGAAAALEALVAALDDKPDEEAEGEEGANDASDLDW